MASVGDKSSTTSGEHSEVPAVSSQETRTVLDKSMFDPQVQDYVRSTFRSAFKITCGLFIIFPLMLSLFFGVGWSPKDNYNNIHVAVADLDGGIIGKTLLTISASPAIPVTIELIKDPGSVDKVSNLPIYKNWLAVSNLS